VPVTAAPASSVAVARGLDGFARAAGTLLPLIFFGLFPLAFAVFYLVAMTRHGVLGYDFGHSFWPAGQAVLDGHTPIRRWTRRC
jgi:hypothetical protein